MFILLFLNFSLSFSVALLLEKEGVEMKNKNNKTIAAMIYLFENII